MTDNYADADDDEQGGREELCWGVQEPGLLQELWVQVPISNHNGTMVPIMKIRRVVSCHAIQCGHCENDFDCSESKFLGENCHLSNLTTREEGVKQLKVSKQL